uniref:protein CutA homolog isoform X1 n=1 Tax=Myodes glareolus TaxID=447135 RepID=UPI00202053F2|nr:protein CutA homolog isoform X1 [Myodes glareolus]
MFCLKRKKSSILFAGGEALENKLKEVRPVGEKARVPSRPVFWPAWLGGAEWTLSWKKILAVILTYPLLRTFTLWLHSSLTRNHISGTYSVVFVNCPNEQIAKDVARAILDKKLATSVNILPKTSSLYFWKGEIEESTEILLLIKTKTSKVSRLSTYVRLAHPFEIPEVFSIAMDQGDARYLKWLEEGMKEK